MKSRAYLLLLAPLFVALFATPRTARAGENTVDVYMQVKPADPSDPKQRGRAPAVEVTVAGGPKVPADKLSLSTTVKGQKVSVKADKVRDYVDGNETIAIAFVIEGQQVWVGTDDWATEENEKYAGALKSLATSLDKLQLGNAGPTGSKGMVVSYSTGTEVRLPMSDLKQVTGAALGSQKDYAGRLNTEMVQGITMAMAELSKTTTARKALILIGDGTDATNDNAKGPLKDLKEQARKQNIQLFAILYKSGLPSESPIVITTMIPGAKTVSSAEGLSSELNAIITKLADRYYATFSGYDLKTKSGLPWDGKEHDLVLKIDQQELDPVTMTMLPIWNPPKEGGFPWLVLVLVAVGLVILIVIGVKVFGAKPVEAPAPMPMPMPMPMGAPEPPKPAGPMKTVMIGAGGDTDGFPIVGWLVALNGSDAYRTQRLKPGVTKIGTAPPADIVVNDGFMSTNHCHIQSSPSGFILVDDGATNGTYVNDKKVQKHELIDNDMITLGKTNFKFKTVN